MISLKAKRRIVIKLWLRDSIREIQKAMVLNQEYKYYCIHEGIFNQLKTESLSKMISSSYIWGSSYYYFWKDNLVVLPLRAQTKNVCHLLNKYEHSIERLKILRLAS